MFKIDESFHNRATYFLIERMSRRLKSGINKAFFQIGPKIQNTIREEVLRGKKTGRTYLLPASLFEKTQSTKKQLRNVSRGKSRKSQKVKHLTHLASAPYETVANLSGRYRKEINYQVDGSVKLSVGSNLDYAVKLEKGFKTKKYRVAPRPSIQNGVRANTKDIETRLNRELLNSLVKK